MIPLLYLTAPYDRAKRAALRAVPFSRFAGDKTAGLPFCTAKPPEG
jgi:hypothetical protein